MLRGFPLLIAAVLALSALGDPSNRYADSPCPQTLMAIGTRFPLTDADIAQVLRGDNDTKQVGEMGRHATSYLASAQHLTGAQKADLWEVFAARIRRLTGRKFTSSPQELDDPNVRAWLGHQEELLVIHLPTGQLYRGTSSDPLPRDWSWQAYLQGRRLRPVGPPSAP